MEKDQTTQTIAQKTLKLFLGCLILALVIFALHYCNSKPHSFIKPNNNDSINSAIAEKEQINEYLKNDNIVLKAKIDSLSNLKPIYMKGKVRIKDSLIFVSDSNCIRNLTVLYNECQKVDSVNNNIITNQETHIMNDSHIIGNLTDIIALKQYRINSDSIVIEDLTMTVKKEKRKGKVKTVLGSALGALSGIGISSIIR